MICTSAEGVWASIKVDYRWRAAGGALFFHVTCVMMPGILVIPGFVFKFLSRIAFRDFFV